MVEATLATTTTTSSTSTATDAGLESYVPATYNTVSIGNCIDVKTSSQCSLKAIWPCNATHFAPNPYSQYDWLFFVHCSVADDHYARAAQSTLRTRYRNYEINTFLQLWSNVASAGRATNNQQKDQRTGYVGRANRAQTSVKDMAEGSGGFSIRYIWAHESTNR